MKITLTTSMSGLGGTENATFRLGRLLKQRGHDIVLASSDGPLIQEAQALGIRWQPIDFYQGGLLGYDQRHVCLHETAEKRETRM